jgi:hypothetical protein
MFSKNTVLAVPQLGCDGYSISYDANIAVTTCNGAVVEGPIDGPLTPVAGFAAVSVTGAYITPEGDELIVKTHHTAADYAIAMYKRVGDHSYVLDSTIDTAATKETFVGTPSRGPTRHLFEGVPQVSLAELALVNQVWMTVGTYGVELGTLVYDVDLSEDGLRVVSTALDGTQAVPYYADRATIAERFTTSTPLDLPTLGGLMLTPDCARLYLMTTDGIAYVPRI